MTHFVKVGGWVNERKRSKLCKWFYVLAIHILYGQFFPSLQCEGAGIWSDSANFVVSRLADVFTLGSEG
ncbi:hypothetical protein A3715_16745 [Oleiphilus sp. HI0009]|nr:hypothetical protein A3715_28510 [Oleiphilus sp. HI0009]KZX86059.1 hypothetical protein A3715_16745 [Oleiphilus sp. HI0009]